MSSFEPMQTVAKRRIVALARQLIGIQLGRSVELLQRVARPDLRGGGT